MAAEQHPVVVIACKVFQDLLEHFQPADMADQGGDHSVRIGQGIPCDPAWRAH